jgi:hypothetical protein
MIIVFLPLKQVMLCVLDVLAGRRVSVALYRRYGYEACLETAACIRLGDYNSLFLGGICSGPFHGTAAPDIIGVCAACRRLGGENRQSRFYQAVYNRIRVWLTEL